MLLSSMYTTHNVYRLSVGTIASTSAQYTAIYEYKLVAIYRLSGIYSK